MKFRNLFLILLGVLLLSCDNDDYPYAEIPSVVLNEFWSQFPDATDVDFSQTGEEYEVDFEIDKKDHSAVINPSGNVLKEKKEIEWNDLPSDVQKNLQETYGQKKIEDPERIKKGGEIYYQVEVNRFLIDEKVVLNNDGKIDSNLVYWK